MKTESQKVKASYINRLKSEGFTPELLEAEDYTEIKKRLGWSESTYKTVLKYLGKKHKGLDEGFRDYIPTQAEIRAIKSGLGSFGKVLVFTGCRYSEMWKMKIYEGYLTINTGKGGEPVKINLIELNEAIRSAVEEWVFIDSIKYTPRQMRHLWDKLVASGKVSKQCIPHSFRHLLISSLIDTGVDMTTVSKTIGHKSTSTTYRYVHNNPRLNANLRSTVYNSNGGEHLEIVSNKKLSEVQPHGNKSVVLL